MIIAKVIIKNGTIKIIEEDIKMEFVYLINKLKGHKEEILTRLKYSVGDIGALFNVSILDINLNIDEAEIKAIVDKCIDGRIFMKIIREEGEKGQRNFTMRVMDSLTIRGKKELRNLIKKILREEQKKLIYKARQKTKVSFQKVSKYCDEEGEDSKGHYYNVNMSKFLRRAIKIEFLLTPTFADSLRKITYGDIGGLGDESWDVTYINSSGDFEEYSRIIEYYLNIKLTKPEKIVIKNIGKKNLLKGGK